MGNVKYLRREILKELKILEEIIILEWEFIRERRLWIQKVDHISTDTFRSVTRSIDEPQI